MKSKVFLMTALLLFSQSLFAQFSIRGKVISAEDMSPLHGAHIVVLNTYKGTYANESGNFIIENLNKGVFHIKISHLGYDDVIEEIHLMDNVVIDVTLFSAPTLSEEVIINATRALSRDPLTHTNINSEEIMPAYLYQDLPYLINMTPSVVVTSDAGTGVGYTSMSIRGSDITRINVTINGIPVNDAESHGVWWVNMPDLVSSAENIQIQRGVGTSTHGAAAFGATLNIQTSQHNEKPYAETYSSFGSFNTLRNTVNIGTGLLKNHWNLDARFSKITSDGYMDRAWSDLGSYYFTGGYYGKKSVVKAVVFSGSERTYMAWDGTPSDSLETNRTFNPSGLYYGPNGETLYYDNQTDNYTQTHYQLHFLNNIASGINSNLSLHYTKGNGYYEQYRQNERLNRYGLSPLEIGDTLISRTDLIRRRWLDNDFYGFTGAVNIDKFSKTKIDIGGGYNVYEGDHFGEIIWGRYLNTDIRHRYYDNTAEKTDLNVFAKINFEVLDGLFLFGDMQFRKINYDFLGKAWVNEEIVPLQQMVSYDFYNPKAGISYELSSSQSVYGYFGISNREPVRRDFTESSPDSRPKPENMQNIEFGYRLRKSKLMAGVNLYFMSYKDQLVLTGEINDVGGYTRTNIPESFRRGLEFEAGYIFNKFLQWTANLSLSQNKIKNYSEHYDKYDENWNWIGIETIEYSNTDIAFSPSIIGASILKASPVKGVHITLSSKYVGKQYLDNSQNENRMLDAYFINDLRLNYNLKTNLIREIEFVIAINNIFAVDYISNGWLYNGYVEGMGITTLEDGFFPQAGRNFALGLNLKF
ncbi:MAG: TonB-dependent receptor [Bacteroidetes bacterium]|nr:TonB-dependent receptor [Bacteroidota bacterium]